MRRETAEAIAAIQNDYAGKIETATAAERDRRDAALIDVPFLVCGIPLRAMTLPDYLALIAAGNAHVSDVQVPREDGKIRPFWAAHNAQLIWLLSPEFVANNEKARDRFVIKTVARLDFVELCEGISEYLREMFADAPRGRPREDGEPVPHDAYGVSFGVHWIARIVKRFPWSRAEVRALPLPELFQYLRFITAEEMIENGKTPMGAGGTSADRLWAEMLGKINALNLNPGRS